MTMRKLSQLQHSALRALRKLGASGDGVAAAHQVGQLTGQSTDGAAYTLRSLVNRGLVALGHHDGDRYGYRLTGEGLRISRLTDDEDRASTLPRRNND